MCNNLKIYVFILISLVGSVNLVNAQLGGIYTVGGNYPDFQTIGLAIDSLNESGISGPVIFNIRNGIYHESVVIDSISGESSQNTLTFQSESGDSSSVIITDSNSFGTIRINNSDNIIFSRISVYSTYTSQPKAMRVINSKNILVENCILSCLFDDFGANTIYLNDLRNSSNKTTIKNCNIFSLDYGIYATGNYDSLYILNNVIDADLELNVNAKIIDNHFVKKIDSQSLNFSSFISNIFYKGFRFSYSTNLNFDSNICQSNCEFLYCDSSIFRSNYFDSLSINHSPFILFYGNVALYCSAILYCNNTDFIGNRLMSDFGFTYNDNCTIINNCINSQFTMWYSDSCKILFNNFSKYSSLKLSTSCQVIPEIKYNNFYDLIPFGHIYQNSIIDYNNYYPAINTTETHSFHIDPMYDNYTHLNAYNPLLTGKAYASDQIQYDIDSNVRHYPYTIGANEICISSLPTDTFFISCGDSIQLQLCNYIDSAEYFWSPLFNITDPFVFNPIVSPDIDTTYYVSMYLNSELIFTDSFRISINQLPVAMATYIMIEPNVQFINNSKCAQAYIWDFGDGSSDSTSHNPSHQYLNVGFYDVKLIAINSFGSDTCYIPITIMSTEIKEEIFSEFLVYPNPAKSKIFIDSNGNIHDARISIYNIHGQLLMQQPLEQETSEIALGSLANGVYFIQLRNENSVLIRKIIKD